MSAIRNKQICQKIAQAALRALYTELVLYPKPGLVSHIDSGAHHDMDAKLFMKSLFSLRDYFAKVTHAGMEGANFAMLQALGITAEARMMLATGGVNTHRGAIFCLGLLAASFGYCIAHHLPRTPENLSQILKSHWSADLLLTQKTALLSKGLAVIKRFHIRGARAEAALGFPVLITHAMPTLYDSLQRTQDKERALVQTLFSIMAELDDTNLLSRGGLDGLQFAKMQAQEFLSRGGVYAHDWHVSAVTLHQAFIAKNLSPSGAADMLAASWFLWQICQADFM